jgi:glycosyltransferase involved in cell wall biosynthesis
MANVLVYSPLYPPQRGGAASYFSTLVRKLDDEHECTVLTTREPDAETVMTDGEITVYRLVPRLHRPPLIVRTAIPSLIALVVGLYLVLARDIDVIHTHSSANAVPGLAVLGMIVSPSLIYDCRDEDFPLWLVTLGDVAYWFSCSSNIDRRLVAAGVDEDRIVRTPVVNPDYVTECSADTEPEPFTVVFVGAVSHHKGIYILLEAFERLRTDHHDVALVVVGDGPERAAVRDHVEQRGYAEDVHLTGRLPHRETLAAISRADVLVLPSESEGLPRVIVEAMELEVPVIATPVGGIPDIVKDGHTGLLVNREPPALAAALERIYASPELRTRLASNATAQIDDWNWETVTNRVSDTYQAVVSG